MASLLSRQGPVTRKSIVEQILTEKMVSVIQRMGSIVSYRIQSPSVGRLRKLIGLTGDDQILKRSKRRHKIGCDL